MTVNWDARAFVHAIERKVTAIDGAVAKVAAESGHDLEARVKQAFTTSHGAGSPTPAAPGSPPAVVTGTLRRSVTTDGPVREGFGTYSAQVGPTVVYARVQELGGGPSGLPARPYMTPAYQQFVREQTVNRRLAAAIGAALGV